MVTLHVPEYGTVHVNDAPDDAAKTAIRTRGWKVVDVVETIVILVVSIFGTVMLPVVLDDPSNSTQATI
jgi:translation initiation factor IF-2